MLILYGLFTLMLLGALGLLAIPYAKTATIFSRGFFLTSILTLVFSLSLYQFTGNHAALKEWLAHGKQHYLLQDQMNQLGGFDGIIAQIKKKLALNPDDAKGWFILGRLYLANENYDDAIAALSKAEKLQPDNPEIKHFYDLAVEKKP